MRFAARLTFAIWMIACTRSEPSPTTGSPLSPSYVEDQSHSSDPFLGGAAANTGVILGPSDSVRIAGTLTSGGGNPAWADSDAYLFTVRTATTVQAELLFAPTGSVWSLAIHRADRSLVAWWGMSTEGRALTFPVPLEPGEYFVHVAAAPPAPATPAPYTVHLRSGDLGNCSSAPPLATYVETEATERANDTVAVDWLAFPRSSATAASDAPEVTGLTASGGSAFVIEGLSSSTATASDSYLDRDTYAFTTGPDTHEVRILLEYAAADVDLDAFVFASEAGRLVGTGIERGGSPERAAVAVAPGKTYWLWIGARDERSIGGDKTLPARYRVTVCGRGAAK